MSIMLHNNKNIVKADNSIGKDYHPIYAKLIERRAELEYPQEK